MMQCLPPIARSNKGLTQVVAPDSVAGGGGCVTRQLPRFQRSRRFGGRRSKAEQKPMTDQDADRSRTLCFVRELRVVGQLAA